MPIVDINGVGKIDFADTMSPEDITRAIETDIVPRFKQMAAEKEKASGFGAGFKSGLEGLRGAYYGAKYGLTGDEADRQSLLESQAKQEKLYQGPGWEETKQAFADKGILSGLGTAASAAAGTLGQSLPYMAAPVAAAALAPEAAIAGVGLGTLGFLGTSAAQYTGQNVGRQVQEQEAAIARGETPQELSLSKAALASIPAAVLDRFALGKTFQGTALGKLFGQEGKEGAEAIARKIVETGGNPSKIGSILKGGARGISAEIPNEVGQQILERAQAGLDLTSDDAIREYKEAAFGATMLGGGFGGVSGMGMRSAGMKTAAGWEARAADETAAFDKKEAERLKAMETTKTSILDTIRAANEKEAQRLQWQGDIKEVGSAALDRSLSMFDTPEGIDTMMGNMEEYFPGMPKKDLAQYKIQLRTYKQRLIAQQKADAARAQESAFAQQTPDIFGEFRPEAPQASIQEAISRPEFQLEAQEQSPQMELDLGQPQATTTAAPATIDDKYLRGFGLDKRSATYKALIGKDLNNPTDVAEVRNIINGVLEGKATNTQAKVDQMLRTDTRLQEQPGLTGLQTQAEMDVEDAEAAREKRNQGLADLLASLEKENAAKEEAARLAREQADAEAAKKEQLSKGLAEEMFGVPTQQYPAVAPEVTGQPSAGVPSEVGVQNQPVGPEPSVDVYDTTGGRGAPEDRGIGGGALGVAGPVTEERVEDAGTTGDTLVEPIPEPAVEPAVPETTDEQRALAQRHADDVGGQVVWQQGDLALVRGYSPISGKPNYAVVKGGSRSRVDVDAYTGNMITPEEKTQLSEAKKQIEAEDKTREQFDPFGGKDLAVSQSIPAGVANVLKGWKKLLGINARIYVTTTADARANQGEFTGDYRAIASAGLEANGGTMRRLPNGDYYISFVTAPSRAKVLETLAHELGHVHEREVFNNAPAETKAAIKAEFENWLGANKTGTAKQLVEALRARKVGKETQVVESMPASELTSYWKSFGEWYADQVSRWATTSEKPVSVVEKFFQKLGRALKAFYQKVHNAKYLPNETFKQYLDKVADSVTFEDEVSTPETRSSAVNRARAALRKQGLSKDEIDEQLAAMTPEEIEADFPAGRTEPLTKEQMRAIEKQARIDGDEEQMRSSTVSRADELLAQAGRSVKQAEESAPFLQTKIDQVKEIAAAPAKWRDLVETMVFSADAKINNEIRRALMDKLEAGGEEAHDALAKLYSISTSQALHNEAVAHQFIEQGNVEYNPELFKFEVKKDDNSWANMIQELKKLADQHGSTFGQMEAYAQTALEARRLKGINEFNAKIEKEAELLESKGKKQRAKQHREKLKFSHMTDEQIAAGNELFKEIPGLNKIVDMWNGIRKNAMKVAVDSGLYSQERAEDLLEIMDYVPFYRVEQLEAKAGPKEFSRGLLDAARDYRFKGSEQEVNNLFDNMERWASYMVRRAVNNKTAQNLVQVSQEVLQEAKEVPKAQRGMEANTIAIWQNGERKFYEFSDPLFVKAFTGLEPVALPAFKALSKFSNALRKNIVLNPLFSVSQLSQDSFAAMLTSGLKHPFKLPLEVMKEFVKTLRGTSEAHEALKAVGAAGVRDYSATISRLDAEMAAGLKAPTTWQKLLSPLEKFSMASDNAVRQAIYNMTMKETGGDKAKAIERAFEIINFRRKGASGTLAIAGQVIPFFNAYLQAQNVAYKVLTGRGVSPTARKEARNILAANTVKIMALAMMYAAVMSDDDDYKKLDPTIRDRHWIIPGTGLMLPTRTDLFSMPKIIAEHTYNLMTDQGFEDGTKAKRAMKDAIVNAITGPTPVPQAFKPLVEVVLNRNFYTGRPIVGRGIENLQTSEQFTASTSEFAKAIGSTGIIAPVNVDHLIRGYLGTTGGLTLMAMDTAINSASGVPTPSRSMQDVLASTPGLSTFVTKEFGGAAKTDFYELKGMVDEVSATINRLQKTGRAEEAKELLAEEGTKELLKVKNQVNQIQSQLSKLRERENLIRALPETRMTADQKETEIRKIRETEQRMLANVSKLRKIAGL